MTSFKVTRIEGVVTIVRCGGCGAEGIAGSIPYVSAATGEAREPEEWYRDEGMGVSYCGTCAPKLMQEDPARSRNNFYTDTAGEAIHPEVL
jgi:hypothetical protein